jgi:soluble lytic murein transglycosylase
MWTLVLAADPMDAMVHLDRAVGDEAALPVEEASTLRIALSEVPGLWARADYSAALEALRRAADEPLLTPVAKLLEAESLAYAQAWQPAAALFEELARSDGDPAVARSASRRLAEVDLELGRFADAAELLRATKERDLGALEHLELGRALLGLSEPALAADALRRAYLLDPEGDVGTRARQLLREQRASLAGLPVREVLAHAERLLRSGQAEQALAAMTALSPPGRSGELEVCAAQCERALGHQQAARDHLSRAIELNDAKAAAVARIQLARAMETDGEVAPALDLLDQVSRWRPHSREGSEALYLAAWIAMEHGDLARSFRLFGQLLTRRRDPHSGEARWWTGWAREMAGNPAAALTAWKPLLASRARAPLGPQALYWSARAQDEVGDHFGAEKLRRTLHDLAPASYYALLDREGLPGVSRSQRLPRCQEGLDPETPLGRTVRRGELLWAMGLKGPARAELDMADRQAKLAPQAVGVAEVESKIGAPARAFALVQARGGGCFAGGLVAPEFFPRPFRGEVENAASAAGIDPVWIWAIMRQESRFNPVARSAALAGGAMQLLGSTAARVAAIAGIPEIDRDDPGQAIQVAAWYLRALSDRFHGDFALVAAAYNAGPEAVTTWMRLQASRRLDVFVEQIPFRETRGYVKEVLANAAAYRALFGPPESLIQPGLPLPAPLAAGASF